MSGTRATAALRFLGWVEAPRQPRPTRPAAQRQRPARQQPSRQQPPRRQPARSARPRQADRRRAPRNRLPLGQRVLIWLGVAEAPVRIAGHPRIRQRVLETLEQRRRRDRVVTAGVGALLCTALLGIGAVRSPLLAVESVSLVGLDDAQQAVVIEALGVRPGTNVLDVDLDALSERVERLPWVSVATARRRLPSTVEVRVAVSRPVAAGTFGETLYLLDATGTAVESVPLDQDGDPAGGGVSSGGDAARLPRVELTAPPTIAQAPTDPQVQAAAAVAAAMPVAVQEWITRYHTTPEGVQADLRIVTPSGPMELVAHLGRPEDVRAKAATLAAVVDEALDRGMRLTAIDVRIPDRPVLRT